MMLGLNKLGWGVCSEFVVVDGKVCFVVGC